MAEYNLKKLIQGGKKLWIDILSDVLDQEIEKDEQGNYIWPVQEDFIPLTIKAILPNSESQPITVYLHKCSFIPEEHHILHFSTNREEYNNAMINALEQSIEDTKIHFVSDYMDN